jgi:hypothetical protein
MWVIFAVLWFWLSACSAASTGVDWRGRAAEMLGIEDHYKGCATRIVFVPVEAARLREWVPEGVVVREPGRAGVAGFDCRYSQMEEGPVSFSMVIVVVEKPDRVFDPGLLDVYEVARATSGKRHREMLEALGYRIEPGKQVFPFTAPALRDFDLKGMHVRVWHRGVYTLMYFKEHVSSIGAVGGCAIPEGTLLHRMTGGRSCDGATGQVAKGVDLSVLIRI